MESLINLDHALFQKINLDWTNPVFDQIFPVITDLHKNPWCLLVVIPLLIIWIWKDRAHAPKWILALVISIGLSDGFAYRVIKGQVDRSRPAYAGVPHLLRTHDHSGPSFPSNHASNMFAAATILTAAFPAGAPVFFLVAFLIAYSRVYVGVHFPLDVLGGAILGTIIAFTVYRLMRGWIRRSKPG